MRARGFTLLEILIAMAIFTLIGLASTGLLTSVIDSNELSVERFDKLQRLQRAMITIERDLLQATPRKIRVNGEVSPYVMIGGRVDDGSDADGIGFVRGGWTNPQMMLPRSTMQYVAYRLRDNKLERLYSNFVDNVTGYEPKKRVLLEGITDLNIEFYSNPEDGEIEWRESFRSQALPIAIAFEITSEDFGTIRRVFALTGDGL